MKASLRLVIDIDSPIRLNVAAILDSLKTGFSSKLGLTYQVGSEYRELEEDKSV